MQTRNIIKYNKDSEAKFICPKCGSDDVHNVREKVNNYYSRQSTYIRDDMYLCAKCLYMDYYTQFKKKGN